MRKIHVGIFTDSMDRGPISVRNYTKNLIKYLIQVGDPDVEIFLIHKQKSDDPLYKKANELLFPFSARKTHILSSVMTQLREFYHNCSIQSKLSKLVDVIHIPHTGAVFAPPLCFYRKQTKLIVTLHGVSPLLLPPKSFYEGFALLSRISTLMQCLKWKILRHKIDLILAVSESEKQNISQKLGIPRDKIKVIYPGVADDFKLNNDEEVKKVLEKYGIDFPFIFHISAYQPRKNVVRLIKAFHRLKIEKKVEHKLVIGGNQSESVREAVKNLNMEKEVTFLGFVDDRDLPKLYTAADLFVFPSLHEGFGLPILEAMACGAPVITSNVFCMPEVAGGAAVLVNPYDVNEIARAMYNVLTNDELRKEMIKRGMRRAKQFSWRKCAEEHLKAYKDILHEPL